MVLGLKERSDKRDAMVLSSSLTGLDVKFIDGVKADEVPDKAQPVVCSIYPGANGGLTCIMQGMALKAGALGSWRSHMNAIRRSVESCITSLESLLIREVLSIIERHLGTGLIMEDDVDWDIRLKSQMPVFAKGVRSITDIPLSTPQDSPYGDDWDVIWPGHCGESSDPLEPDDRLYIMNDNPTVAPKANLSFLNLLKDYPDNTRIGHRSIQPVCTFAYGVSQRGAQKILAVMGLKAY